MTYYVLVRELNDYSYSDYNVVGVYRTRNDAETFKKLREKEQEYKNDIASCKADWMDYGTYVIHEVEEENTNICLEEELRNLEKMYHDEMKHAKAWKKEFDRQKKIEEEEYQKKVLQDQKERVYAFMEWWDNGNDPWFQEKKQARIREIKDTLRSYIYKTKDSAVYEWVIQKGISL